jgi:hypothetical protein
MRADDFAAKFLKVTEGGTYLHRECGRAGLLSLERSISTSMSLLSRAGLAGVRTSCEFPYLNGFVMDMAGSPLCAWCSMLAALMDMNTDVRVD